MELLWELDLTQVNEEELERWLGEMDEGSRTRVDAMSNPRRRKEIIAGDHLARTALAEKRGKAPGEIVIHRGENGKPYAEGGCFSISHSGERVVCAVSERAVGVDVEKIRPTPARVAERYFSDGEKQLLQQDSDAFWRIWTGKEALCKLTGEGLAGICRCDTMHPPENVMLTCSVSGGYVISVAMEGFDNFLKSE